MVYIGSNDNHVYALDAAIGTEQWRFKTGGSARSPTVANGTVYVGSIHLYALDGATGTKRWRFETGGRVKSSAVVVDGTVYVGGGDTLYALSGTNTEVFTGTDSQSKTNTSIYAACSNCGANLSDHDTPQFCPECGQQDPL